MTEHSLAVREATALVQRHDWDDAKRALLARTIAKGATQDELDLFVAVCQHTGLDPWAKQIYFVKYKDQVSIQVGIDGYRALAARTGHYGGQIGPEWADAGGDWHDVWLEDGPPAAARVGIIRAGWDKPIFATCRFKSYVKDSQFWRQAPDNMLAKCAESLAFRKAFPMELGGYAPRPAELDDVDRPAYVDADGVVDEQHADRPPALEQPSARAHEIAARMDAAVAEADALAAPDAELDAVDRLVEEISAEPGTAEPPARVTEQTKLACAAFVDEVKAANPKLRITLPPETAGDVGWRRWLLDNQKAWRDSEHNPARASKSR